ncbi:hypothetical protein RFI_14221 [Reticulomyxa filosa]|uniref:Uncharacterized protein n=1 Tax=Reticulomyxa filosa TaxID=46433 RepID=X6NAP5_RETFI|nr:hypothetical protein RFI_14221 [Reticulomyxa filosa]|eukprot:ETO22968.1 hypothetical protein RFI_14221 [Reticulomyxa filosa]
MLTIMFIGANNEQEIDLLENNKSIPFECTKWDNKLYLCQCDISNVAMKTPILIKPCQQPVAISSVLPSQCIVKIVVASDHSIPNVEVAKAYLQHLLKNLHSNLCKTISLPLALKIVKCYVKYCSDRFSQSSGNWKDCILQSCSTNLYSVLNQVSSDPDVFWEQIQSVIFSIALLLSHVKDTNVLSDTLSPCYKLICNDNVGNFKAVTTRLTEMIGSSSADLQQSLHERVKSSKGCDKFKYLLWYNLLSSVQAHVDKDAHVIDMTKNLGQLSSENEILAMIEMEMRFYHSYTRIFPSEEMLLLTLFSFVTDEVIHIFICICLYCIPFCFEHCLHFPIQINTQMNNYFLVLKLMEKHVPNCGPQLEDFINIHRTKLESFGNRMKCKHGVDLIHVFISTMSTKHKPSKSFVPLACFMNSWIPNVRTPEQADLLFQLLREFPELCKNDQSCHEVMGNPLLLREKRFLRNNDNNQVEHLTKVFNAWLRQENGVIECIERIIEFSLDWSTFQTVYKQSEHKNDPTFRKLLEVLSKDQVDISFKKQLVGLIKFKWTKEFFGENTNHLDKKDRCECVKVVHGWVDIESQRTITCQMMDRLLEGFKPFNSKHWDKIICYFSSAEGGQLINLLIELKAKIKSNALQCLEILDNYCSWFAQLSGSILEQTIDVPTMIELVEKQKWSKLLILQDKIGNNAYFVKKTDLDHILTKFTIGNQYKNELDKFFEYCNINKQWFGDELNELEEQKKQLEKWSEWTLKTALQFDWRSVEKVKKILDAFAKISQSEISMSMWRALVAKEEAQWKLLPVAEMNTYQLCAWIRENEKELLAHHSKFDFEKYIHTWVEQEITVRWEDSKEKLLTSLYPHQPLDKIPDEAKSITYHLWDLIQKRKEAYFDLLRNYPPSHRTFSIHKITEMLGKLKFQWQSTYNALSQKTIPGEQINANFGFLRSMSTGQIKTQIRLLYKPYTCSMETLRLTEDEIKKLQKMTLSKFESKDAKNNETNLMHTIQTELNFGMPDLMDGSGILSIVNFICACKSEVELVCNEARSSPALGSNISFRRIINACDISPNLENWAQFMMFNVLLFPMTKNDFKKYETIANDLREVFHCFNCREALQLLRDSATVLSSLFHKDEQKYSMNWEDKEWQENKKLLISFDSMPMKDILAFWNNNKFFPLLMNINTFFFF